VDARSLDQLADDLPAIDVLDNDSLSTRGIHPIIQSRHSARAR
jgi:hypothetical protein